MAQSCETCLYQDGKKEIEKRGGCVFCLVRSNWFEAAGSCNLFVEDNPNLPRETKTQFALRIREEESEERRLRQVFKSARFSMFFMFVFAFALFIAAIKFFDYFIF